MLQDLQLHHAAPDGLLLALPSGHGYGSLRLSGLGGDALAARMLKNFAARPAVPAVPGRTRDEKGYTTLSVCLADVSSDVHTLDPAVRTVLSDAFRKAALCGVGTVVAGKVARVTAQGLVLTLPTGVAAIALDKSDSVAAAAAVVAGAAATWVVDYDAASGVAVTVLAGETRSVATDGAGWAAVAASLPVGAAGHGRVLYAPPAPAAPAAPAAAVGAKRGADVAAAVPAAAPPRFVVAEIDVPRAAASGATLAAPAASSVVLAFVLVDPSAGAIPAVGAAIDVRVRYSPAKDLVAATPFLIADAVSSASGAQRSTVASSSVRLAKPSSRLAAEMPWRQAARTAASADGADGATEPQIRRRRLEEAIDAYERGQAGRVPTTPDDFTKLLLASPNSSFLWTQFIAHHIGLQQYEQARQVTEKALSTIGVRESKELLNVWVAYMNLENLHGTAESLTAVFRRAVQRADDTLLVHERLAEIFAATGKHQQLLALCRVMTTKYRATRRVWERLGCVLVNQDRRDQLKRLVKDMGAALSKQDQCIAIEHIAIHEYKAGSVEHGRQLFEGLVAKVPKKSDMWAAYLDQEMSLLARKSPVASVPGIRLIFERLTTVSLPPKVMQQLLTRYLGFEQAHGTPADVEKVKDKARQYVESRLTTSAAASGSA